MFAIIETGGKQYRVEPGDVLDIELLGSLALDGENVQPPQTPEKGTAVRFERVLAVGGVAAASAASADEKAGSGSAKAAPHIGAPLVEGALVTASLLGVSLGPKIRVFKHKRRNTQRKTRGHRQHLHRVRIDEIQLP
jgi:large subunit ribosomal protein L21